MDVQPERNGGRVPDPSPNPSPDPSPHPSPGSQRRPDRGANPIRLSVVVPTYLGAGSLPRLVAELGRVLEVDRHDGVELVVVNDASPDDTEQVLADLAAANPWVRGINLFRNHGQPVATMCGLAHARGDLVATMDDDLQHPPDQLPMLVSELRAHPELDAVVGTWTRDEGLVRDLGSWVHAWSDRVAHGTPRGFRHSAFRVIRRPAVDAMVQHRTRTPVVGPLLTQVTTRVANLEVRHDERRVGRSNFRMVDGARLVVTNFIQGSTLPLRLMGGFGVATAAIAFLVAGALAVRALIGSSAPAGWLSAFLAIVFFGGIILFQISLVGQYIRVIVGEVRGSPRWTIRTTTPGAITAADVGPVEPGTAQAEERQGQGLGGDEPREHAHERR